MTFLTRQCYQCNGKGFHYVKDWFDPTDVVPEDCDLCNGTGKLQLKKIQDSCNETKQSS